MSLSGQSGSVAGFSVCGFKLDRDEPEPAHRERHHRELATHRERLKPHVHRSRTRVGNGSVGGGRETGRVEEKEFVWKIQDGHKVVVRVATPVRNHVEYEKTGTETEVGSRFRGEPPPGVVPILVSGTEEFDDGRDA